jgi:hypothetical protein
MPARGRVTLLVVSHEPALRQTYGLIFLSARYAVRSVDVSNLDSALQRVKFHMVLIDHTLTELERKATVRLVRLRAPGARIVALHASAGDCGADVAMDSRDGAAAIIEAIAKAATGQLNI